MTSFSFHAQVAAEAIEKVGRLFNASIDDILNELLQNARRAGAAKVLIDQIDDPRFGPAIRIADDGAGLDDPRSLFSLGRSEWSKSLALSEDAAGMGFFSLANRGAMIVAGQKGTDSRQARRRGNIVGVTSDDERHRAHARSSHRLDHMRNHRTAGDRMQHLGFRRLHARAVARCENNG